MSSQKRSSIVTDSNVFLGNVECPILRDYQIKELKACFKEAGINAWVHGPTGAGKTLCIRYLLERAKRTGVLTVYVSCRERFTFLSVVEFILDEVKPLRSPQRSREYQLSVLKEALGHRRTVVALDEVDVLKQKDVTDLVHHLCAYPRVSVICIAPTRRPLLGLPESVRSRLFPRQVLFPRYRPEEIREILVMVVGRGLRSGSWSERVLHEIGKRSYGDARRAIALLRHVVQRAEDEGSETIQPRHLKRENFDHYTPHAEDTLAGLSSHHRILYDLVCLRDGIPGPELEGRYIGVCRKRGLEPVASRTVSKYLEALCQLRILKREHGAGTSGWVYRPGVKMGSGG